jgi:ribonuclease T1
MAAGGHMFRRLALRLFLFLALAACLGIAAAREPLPTVALRDLPAEAQTTYRLIRQGGPFPYRKDGSVFGNFEKRLPLYARGYYREYTVPTPGARNRGARRIVTGNGGEFYYTADHYNSFRRIRE